ncbi:hypothetical protein AV530_009357 [Patagioenas fasciata monilis]|uniref:Uncharacterized protein n=1 Tax=Patagioenas fasciata monilis TaxID=372326 RepID=A0A1V4JIP3_PATFA|nr:hypothetical protein AV530_009357 [Patagioenas fasciata monilis]
MAFKIETFHRPWEWRPCNNIRIVWEEDKDLSGVWKFPVATAGEKKCLLLHHGNTEEELFNGGSSPAL